MIELFDCPICCGKTEWCGDHNELDPHDCHYIKCVGECGALFDMVSDNTSVEELHELKAIAAKKFNHRKFKRHE